jgi:uncharacterized protein YdeI (YjbR/CyaY-like superfamily)
MVKKPAERTDPRVDDYIAKSAPFARPILRKIRAAVHAGCPDVEETMKWSFPHFMHHGILCSMASFKSHCAFGFWKEQLMTGTGGPGGVATPQFGRVTSVKDLPGRAVFQRLVREAARLNEDGVKPAGRPVADRSRSVRAPADLLAALRNNARARAAYDALSPSHKREYIEWITEAKRDETRKERVATAVEWMAEGRIRNWKYVR